ncbi:hypothetical protein [Bdellovibrio sp. HCB337]|uniref:hypothetical protein n=1 Tax=Bdellovibrio sp. HCB337 TaxID=3394358 RepID=UPI0039A4C6F5
MKRRLLLALSCMCFLACSSFSGKRNPALSEPFAPVEPGSVFASYTPLAIELEAPLNELFKKVKATTFPDNKDLSVDGKLSYNNESNQRVEIPVEVHVKGFSSLFSCSFPKLELKMKSKERAGTLFATTKSIDLNTHCFEEGTRKEGDMMAVSIYNHREALIYRMAEVLEIPTFKARPVFVRYKNTQIAAVENKEYRAFFLEDMGSFRKRLNAKEVKGVNDPLKAYEIQKDPSKESQYVFSDVKSSPMIDAEDASRVALFQSMVSNGDWFIKMNPIHLRDETYPTDKTNLWNTKIAELPNGRWVLFPQDFSLSGILIGFNLAPLSQITFGFSPQATQNQLKQTFLARKPEIYALLGTLTQDPKGPELMKITLDVFYKNLEINPN